MTSTFASFFLGGFECSCLVRRDGVRLDLLDSTGHAACPRADYELLFSLGINAVRDGLRWHRIEREPGRYDWSDLLPFATGARQARMQVLWDLSHYGWPEHVDIWSAAFPERFADYACKAAGILAEVGGSPPLLCPINEISFWSWAGGEVGRFGPCATGRGGELKRQLVRAWIAATQAVQAAVPGSRFVSAEPAIHIDPGGIATEEQLAGAEHNRLSQFEAIDLLVGRREPELGGHPGCVDIVGINFYPDNQWYYGGQTIPLGHHAYRPLIALIDEWHGRYGRPMLIAETGAEGSARAPWLHYVCDEVGRAQKAGIPVEGVCIYPILEYRGWENGRACATGVLSAPDPFGRRTVYEPLAAELARQRARFARPERSGADLRIRRVSELA